MMRVLAPANLKRAYQRVLSSKGAPGADGMTVDELAGYVKQYRPILKSRLLAGEYHPQGVRAVDIPKPRGGTRQYGGAIASCVLPMTRTLTETGADSGKEPSRRFLDMWLLGLRDELAPTTETESGDDDSGSLVRPTQRPAARSAES
jgi:hypothetical protein